MFNSRRPKLVAAEPRSFLGWSEVSVANGTPGEHGPKRMRTRGWANAPLILFEFRNIPGGHGGSHRCTLGY